MITESAVHDRRDSFTFKWKSITLVPRRIERLSGFFDLFVARRLRQFLSGRQRIVRNAGAGARNRLVDRLLVWPRADFFPVLGHGASSFAGLTEGRASRAERMFPRLLRTARSPPIY